jgi:hypothetical protein
VEEVIKARKAHNTTAVSTEHDVVATEDGGTDENPFSFLSQEQEAPVDQQPDASTKKKQGFGTFLQKVAKSTTAQLERGMHQLAVKADQGRSADLLVMGLYDEQERLLHMTESQPLEENCRLAGIRFVVPLEIPPDFAGSQVLIKLWIRSGAALIKSTGRNYLLGSVHVPVSNVRQPRPVFLQKTLQSAVLVDGRIDVVAVHDNKMAPLCGRGWSLADPVQQGYGTLFHLPLDQSYAYSLEGRPVSTLVATERTTESAVVLPVAAACARLAADAAKVSLQHGRSVATRVHENRHDSAVGEHVDCHVRVSHFRAETGSLEQGAPSPQLSASWQRPDAIFEVDLMQPTKLPLHPSAAFGPNVSFRFFPKPRREGILPSVLRAAGGQVPANTGYFLGNLRFTVTAPRADPNTLSASGNHFGPDTTTSAFQDSTWERIVALESLPHNNQHTMEFAVYDSTGRRMGSLVMNINMQLVQQPPSGPEPVGAVGGLVLLTGLTQLTDGVLPALDFEEAPPSKDPALVQRRSQLVTMGNFITHAYMEQHMKMIREADVAFLREKAEAYSAVLARPQPEDVPSYKDKTPRPFRPSSSRTTKLLSGIPFNVHTASLSLDVLEPGMTKEPVGAVFTNITCGAPSDHTRGFGNVFGPPKETTNGGATAASVALNSPVGAITGGLRRLEARRRDLAQEVSNLQTALIMSIANFFVENRQSGKLVNHIPARHTELQGLRWKLFEAVQCLHHLTWGCAVRRSSVFSQALGLAITSYLASLSDATKLQSTWPDIWVRHGYLVSFEGLLSAAGKELGMIEDASVGIAMLSLVRVILVPDDGAANPSRVPVPYSPYVKWVHLWTAQNGDRVEYILQIGVVPSYYNQRIPDSIKNNVAVRLYPLLFEVGVDIRQWGAHAVSNTKKDLTSGSNDASSSRPTSPALGGLIDDEDDDVGVADDDVLVQLNYEAFQKMNTYAQRVSPAAETQATATQKTHPMLATLFQHIVSSAGKMNHDILDEAAMLAQQLGGGGVVFCKSGKDRTAMHVTYKQAQFANKFREQTGSPNFDNSSRSPTDTTLEDATIMRIHGTRLPICEKNVGQAKYAFNSLQVKFMPDALKPPMNTLAGFLKGGKVFGGIES